MKTDTHELDLLQFARLVLDDDPAIFAEVLQAADRLQEQEKHQQAAEVLQRLAERLVQPGCRLPPLARCHLFAKLGGVLARLANSSEAETWLRRAVTLAEESQLSELSCCGFRQTLERLLEIKRKQAGTSTPTLEPSPCVVASNETAVPSAPSIETVASVPSGETRRRKALQHLTEEQRQLLQWCGREQRSVDEVAVKLGLPCHEVVLRFSEAMNRFNVALRLEAQPHTESSASKASPQGETAASIQSK